MKISIDDRWRAFIDAAVTEGRYGSADDVVGEDARLQPTDRQKAQR